MSFLDNLEANEDERVWLKRQSDGELDEHRLTEGLTGESSIYKRRGLDKRKHRYIGARSGQLMSTIHSGNWQTSDETKEAPLHFRFVGVDVSKSI